MDRKKVPSWFAPSIAIIYRITLFFHWCFFKLFYRYRIYGRENFYDKAAIIAANHSSFYDPPIVAISWPAEIHFLARETLFDHALFGKIITKVNAHPVKGGSSDIKVFKTIGDILSQGKQVLLFPEGTRSSDPEIGEIKPGIGMLAARSKCAIVPVYIHGAFAIWNRHRRLPKLGGKIACIFGSAIKWDDFAHLPKKEAQDAIAQKLLSSLQDLKAWYEDGAKGIPS